MNKQEILDELKVIRENLSKAIDNQDELYLKMQLNNIDTLVFKLSEEFKSTLETLTKEPLVGNYYDYDGNVVVCVEGRGCRGCLFNNSQICNSDIICTSLGRFDKTGIIIKYAYHE
jgi:hypothetical protein